MSIMRCGFTEGELLKTVALLKQGKSYQEAVKDVIGVVEPDNIRARRLEICKLAKVDPARAGDFIAPATQADENIELLSQENDSLKDENAALKAEIEKLKSSKK